MSQTYAAPPGCPRRPGRSRARRPPPRRAGRPRVPVLRLSSRGSSGSETSQIRIPSRGGRRPACHRPRGPGPGPPSQPDDRRPREGPGPHRTAEPGDVDPAWSGAHATAIAARGFGQRARGLPRSRRPRSTGACPSGPGEGRPSGLKATPLTQEAGPVSTGRRRARGISDVPQVDREVPRRRGDGVPVGGQGERGDLPVRGRRGSPSSRAPSGRSRRRAPSGPPNRRRPGVAVRTRRSARSRRTTGIVRRRGDVGLAGSTGGRVPSSARPRPGARDPRRDAVERPADRRPRDVQGPGAAGSVTSQASRAPVPARDEQDPPSRLNVAVEDRRPAGRRAWRACGAVSPVVHSCTSAPRCRPPPPSRPGSPPPR